MKETFLHVNTELASWKGFFFPLIFISRKPDVAKTQGLPAGPGGSRMVPGRRNDEIMPSRAPTSPWEAEDTCLHSLWGSTQQGALEGNPKVSRIRAQEGT